MSTRAATVVWWTCRHLLHTNMATAISLLCDGCGNEFDKPLKEYKRRVKLGQVVFFCNQSCQVRRANLSTPHNHDNLNRTGRKADSLSPFRWFVSRAVARRRKGDVDITPDFLQQLWESQQGKCPFTGWMLKLPRTTGGWDHPDPQNASLDRIDCAKGYVQGNVRFVAIMANIARGTFTDDQLREFCQAVSQNGGAGGFCPHVR